MTDGSTTSRTGLSRKQSVKSVLCQVSKFLDGFELGSAYFVNFEELRLKMAILKMKMALLSLKKLKMALCAGTPIHGHYILSDGCYFLSYRYNLVCVAHYFLPYRYDSLSYQYNILWDAYYFFCNIQNPFCHAFNLLCHGYNLFCYSNYSLCDIHYFQCCALNFLSVVHNSASTQYNFKVILSPLQFPVS